MANKCVVAITDHVFPSLEPEREVLNPLGVELRPGQCATEEEVIALAGDADAVLNCYARMPARVLRSLERCRIIARYGIGVDTIDLETATELGILVTNVPDYCVGEVSDHALALLLALARKVVFANALAKRGQWRIKAAAPIQRLRGSALGLVGFGQIARDLVPKAQSLGLDVLVHDPYVSETVVAGYGARQVDLGILLQESDFVSLHAPLTAETRGLFGEKAFEAMKASSFLINTARGPLVEEAALIRALEEGWIAGAALDVMESEPPALDSPLFRFDNLIVTPHIAFYSEASLVELQTRAAQEVARVLQGETPRSLVNREVLITAQVRRTFVTESG